MAAFRHLLVAADGSDAAANAGRFAGDLAFRFDGSVRAVAVVPSRPAVAAAWVGANMYAPIDTGDDRAFGQAKLVSETTALLAEKQGCRMVEAVIEVGDPAHELATVAERWNADAIVMGRRGTGNLSGLFLGSVSTRVSQLSERTVITVRGGLDLGVERVLVAVDGSDHARRAAEAASVLAQAYDADVDILHVVSTARVAPFGLDVGPGIGFDRVADTLRERGEQVLAEAEGIVAERGPATTASMVAGDPATGIVEYAERIGSDVICIGRRGLGNVSGLLLGSVSHSVAHGAQQTVVTVSSEP